MDCSDYCRDTPSSPFITNSLAPKDRPTSPRGVFAPLRGYFLVAPRLEAYLDTFRLLRGDPHAETLILPHDRARVPFFATHKTRTKVSAKFAHRKSPGANTTSASPNPPPPTWRRSPPFLHDRTPPQLQINPRVPTYPASAHLLTPPPRRSESDMSS